MVCRMDWRSGRASHSGPMEWEFDPHGHSCFSSPTALGKLLISCTSFKPSAYAIYSSMYLVKNTIYSAAPRIIFAAAKDVPNYAH